MSILEDEPVFTPVAGDTGTYTRPLLGSEAFFDGMHIVQEGSAECIMGFTFKTTLAGDVLRLQFKDALLKLRFNWPLFSASIVNSPDSPSQRSWVYATAKGYEAAAAWADTTMHVAYGPIDSEDFILQTAKIRLPYHHPDGHSQHFALYLFVPKEPGDTCAMFMHGSHSLMDGFPTFDAQSRLFRWAAGYDEATSARTLNWGSELKNLSPGPLTLTGGAMPGYKEGSIALLQKYDEIVFNPVATTHSLRPQRSIRAGFQPVRVHHTLDQETTTRVLNALGASGRGITQLFEAAMILAIFHCNPVTPEEDRAVAHVTLDSAVVSLERNFVGKWKNDHPFVSCLVYIALTVPLTQISKAASIAAQIEAVMDSLAIQYKVWLQEPYLPYLNIARQWVPLTETAVTSMNPYAHAITNFGLIDKRVPVTIQDKFGEEVIHLEEFKFGHRWWLDRTCLHIWTFNGQLRAQLQASDVWDAGYLQEFMGETFRIAMAFVESSIVKAGAI